MRRTFQFGMISVFHSIGNTSQEGILYFILNILCSVLCTLHFDTQPTYSTNQPLPMVTGAAEDYLSICLLPCCLHLLAVSHSHSVALQKSIFMYYQFHKRTHAYGFHLPVFKLGGNALNFHDRQHRLNMTLLHTCTISKSSPALSWFSLIHNAGTMCCLTPSKPKQFHKALQEEIEIGFISLKCVPCMGAQ